MKHYSEELHRLIPGGAHTYSRGDDQFPENAPPILLRGKGCYVWDPDGNKYLDYGMALRAVSIGYANKPIADAAIREIRNGNNLTRPSVIELEAARAITGLIPCAEMVKFGKNGSNVTSAAVKLARAYTGRKYIARCQDHPFFSFDDWFIGDTVVDNGVPDEIKSLTVRFRYNDIASLEKLFSEYKDKIAAVIMEPVTGDNPAEGYLQKVKDICGNNKAVFIMDEMITGFRWHLQGAQKYFNVIPDLATFGKAMSNGHSVAALVGKKEIMNLGGILEDGIGKVFLISATHGGEMSSLGALVKTIEIYKENDVVGHMWDYGKKLKDGMNSIAASLGIKDCFYVEGCPCSPGYCTKDRSGKVSLELRTLFSQEMVKNGVLIPWISLSYSHGEKELRLTLKAAENALKIYSKALQHGVRPYLKGRSIRPVFRKTN